MSFISVSTNKLMHTPFTMILTAGILSGCASIPGLSKTNDKPTITYRNNGLSQPIIKMNTDSNLGYKKVSSNTRELDNNVNKGALISSEDLDLPLRLLEAADMRMLEYDRNTVVSHGNLWQRLRRGYRLQNKNQYNPSVERQKVIWMSETGKKVLNKTVARASRYLHYTVSQAEKNSLPTELALLPVIESSYDPSLVGAAGATGLWQMTSGKAKHLKLAKNSEYDGRKDIIESTRGAYQHLLQQYKVFGNWELALAAYHSGSGTIKAAIKKNKSRKQPTDFWSLSLKKDTVDYVSRLLAISEILNDPDSYGLKLADINNSVYFTLINDVKVGTSLLSVSRATGVSLDELRYLNPGLLKLQVTKNTTPRILIPRSVSTDKQALIPRRNKNGYNKAPALVKNNPVYNGKVSSIGNGNVYIARKNDTLDKISKRVNLPVNQLVKWNNMSATSVLKAGQVINLYAGSDASVSNNAPSSNYSSSNNSNNNSNNSASNRTTKPAQPKVSYSNKNTTGSNYHIVQSGDQLGFISEKYRLPLATLVKYNNINVDSKLSIGQKLWLIPNKVATTRSMATTAKPKPKSNRSQATATKKSVSKYKGSVSDYRVQSGDSLSKIAHKLGSTSKVVASLNAFNSSHQLKVGELIKVPANKNQINLLLRNKSIKYKVQSGDSLSRIAEKFSVPMKQIAAINDLGSDNKLYKGGIITIPSKSAYSNKKVNYSNKKSGVAVVKNTSSRGKKNSSYTVKRGDSLSTIAKKHNTSVPELVRMNRLSANSKIKFGKVLKVPATTMTYIVQPGDGMIKIATKFNTSRERLASINGLNIEAPLKIGQKIIVPLR